MASVGREKKIGLTPTGHSERKSKFCDNEIPSPAVPRYAFDRRRQDPLSQAKSQNRRRRNLVGDQNYSAAPYNDYHKSLSISTVRQFYFHLRLRRGEYTALGKRDEGRGDFPKERYKFVFPFPLSLFPNSAFCILHSAFFPLFPYP